MKNLFAAFKNTTENNFSKFFIRELSNENETRLNDLSEEGNELKKEKLPPNWLVILAKVFIYIGLPLCLAFFVVAIRDFSGAFQNIGVLLYVGLGLLVIGFGFLAFRNSKIKKSNSDPEVKQYVTETVKTVKECLFELDIPETAPLMDVFFVVMKKNKKGEEITKKFSLITFVNMEFRLFVENDLFCFGANDAVIGLPLSSIKRIIKIKKRIPILNWNKKEQYNSDKFKQYKMYENSGIMWSRYYYKVDLDIKGEEYYFFIPCYEKDVFLKTLCVDVPVIEK